MLDVAIVIPNLNGEAVLGPCLAALDAAAESWQWKAVVVDNASADTSRSLLASRFPEVTVIANPENRGFATACNQGGRVADSRYVLLLNNDVVMPPGTLSRLLAHAEAHPRLGAITPLMCWPDGRVQGPRLGLRGTFAGEAVKMDWAPGTCLLLRRDALDAIGWLDEAFFFYNEDIDLSWRLRKAGYGITCLRSVRVSHQEGASTRSDLAVRARAIAEGYRGSLLLTRKHHPWATALVRVGLRIDLAFQSRRLAKKQARGETLSDREQAFLVSLPASRVAVATDA